MASRVSSSLYLDSCAGIEKTGVVTLSVHLRALCRVASRGSSSLYSECDVGIGKIGVSTLSVVSGAMSYGLEKLFIALFGILNRRLDDRRRYAQRQSANVVSYGAPKLHFALFGILGV
jgi:hypothetical protein